MGFNAPSTRDLSRKHTDRSWRQLEEVALKMMNEDRDLTKAKAIKKALMGTAQ